MEKGTTSWVFDWSPSSGGPLISDSSLAIERAIFSKEGASDSGSVPVSIEMLGHAGEYLVYQFWSRIRRDVNLQVDVKARAMLDVLSRCSILGMLCTWVGLRLRRSSPEVCVRNERFECGYH